MKVMSIGEIATFKISNDDRIKLMILKEKWKELFLDLSQNSSIIDFKENIIDFFSPCEAEILASCPFKRNL